MYKPIATVLSSLLLLVTAASVQAQSLPHYYPNSFDRQGIITSTGSSEIFVSAQRYQLDANVRVHSLATEFASRRLLRGGAEIGFTTARGKKGVTKITEIWLLPDGTVKLP
jgi:hypothetical protein